jgi:hypothetical protein
VCGVRKRGTFLAQALSVNGQCSDVRYIVWDREWEFL